MRASGISRPGGLDLFLFGCALAVVVFQSFVPPQVGLADNGDFAKMILRFALAPEDGDLALRQFYAGRYVYDPRHLWVAGNASSELILIRTALALGWLFDDRTFDIRLMGAIHASLFLAAFAWLLVLLRPVGRIGQTVIALAALAIFGDVLYVSYFNSLYTDAGAMVFLFLTVVAALHLVSRHPTPPWLLSVFTACAALVVLSKPQHAPLALVLAPLAFYAGRRKRAESVVLAGVVLVAGFASFRAAPWPERAQALFNVVFQKWAKAPPDPRQNLAELGLDPELLKYAGMHAFMEGSPAAGEEWLRGFAGKISQSKLASFYLRHPERALWLMGEQVRDWGWEMRIETLGNYERKTGKSPLAKARSFGWWSGFRSALFHFVPYHLAAWYVAVVAGALWWMRKRRSGAALVCLVVAAMAVMEFVISTLADACETARHLFLFHCLTDITVVFVLAAVTSLVRSGKLPAAAAGSGGLRFPI